MVVRLVYNVLVKKSLKFILIHIVLSTRLTRRFETDNPRPVPPYFYIDCEYQG